MTIYAQCSKLNMRQSQWETFFFILLLYAHQMYHLICCLGFQYSQELSILYLFLFHTSQSEALHERYSWKNSFSLLFWILGPDHECIQDYV